MLSSLPRLAPSSWNCTPATPTLSVALADTGTIAETVAPLTGEVIDTAGGIPSDVGGPPALIVWVWMTTPLRLMNLKVIEVSLASTSMAP